MSDAVDAVAHVDAILMRAAEQVGDLTQPAMAGFYLRFPEAKPVFDEFNRGWMGQLEGQMIENSVYCLMRWCEAPGEIEVMLLGSVSHHQATLHVPADWYGGLIEATAEVVGDTIPVENAAEQKVWAALRGDLRALIERCAVLT